MNQLGEWQIPFALIFTKADKETQRVVAANVKAFLDAMRKEWEFLPAHFVTSAVKKLGRDKVLKFIGDLNQNYTNEAGGIANKT